MMYVEFMKNFLPADSTGYWLLDSFSHPVPKTSDSYFVDMMCDELMKNFFNADSSELIAVRLILASFAQKQVIPTL